MNSAKMEKNAKDFSKKASGLAAVWMKSFKEKAQSLKEEANKKADRGCHMRDHLVAQMRSKASKMSGEGSSSVPRGEMALPHGVAVLMPEGEKVKSLSALGFSPAAARHALLRCRGSIDLAAIWLLDEANSDERLAAELVSGWAGGGGQGSFFTPGSMARIIGLRGAAHLNGLPVVLQGFDPESQRWVVQMTDGSAKSIRECNLDWLSDEAAALAAAEMENALLGPGGRDTQAGKAAKPPLAPAKPDAQATVTPVPPDVLQDRVAESSLRNQVREMLGVDVGSDEATTLEALSVQELLELVESLAGQSGKTAVPDSGKTSVLDSNVEMSSCCAAASQEAAVRDRQQLAEQVCAAATAPSAASNAAAVIAVSDTAAATAVSSTPAAEVVAGTATSSTAAVTAASSTAAAVSEVAGPAESSAADASLASPATPSVSSTAPAVSSEAVAVDAPPAVVASSGNNRDGALDASSRSNDEATANTTLQPEEDGAADTTKTNAELAEREQKLQESTEKMADWEAQQRLQQEAIEAREAKTASDIKELERRQEAARLAAEDRELRLLEGEEDQIRVGRALQEEQERLEQQRRALWLLQQSLLKQASGSEGSCIEMPLDDSGCTAVEEAAGEAVDLSFGAENGADEQATVVFKPPRRSLGPRASRRSVGLAQSPADAVEAEASPGGTASSRSPCAPEDQDEDEAADSAEESDEDEEVWDLDWSQVSTKLLEPRSSIPAQEGGSSSSSTLAPATSATEGGDGSAGPDVPDASPENSSPPLLTEPVKGEATVSQPTVPSNAAAHVEPTWNLETGGGESRCQVEGTAPEEHQGSPNSSDTSKQAMKDKLDARRRLVEAQSTEEAAES